jgi:RHS repeat-associated protein
VLLRAESTRGARSKTKKRRTSILHTESVMVKKQTSPRRRKAKSPLADHPFFKMFRRSRAFTYAKEIAACLFLPPRPRGTNPRRRKQSRMPTRSGLDQLVGLQQLEPRIVLYGYITVQNQPSSGQYVAPNTATYSAVAPGVLSGANGSDPPFTAHLVTQAAHGTAAVNGNGSWSYTANAGYTGSDSFTFDATDGQSDTSNTGTVSLSVVAGALSVVDQTKLPADTLQEPIQILGSSSGQPGTAANLSLVYHSNTAVPSQVLEEDFQPSMEPVVSETLEVSDTFNGTQAGTSFVSTSNLSGNNPTIRLSLEANTASLATGRYGYVQNVSGMYSEGAVLLSSASGAANVVNDQSSPFGVGWEMPGIDHIYSNSASGVPAGVLLTMGDGTGWYFTQGSGSTYTSPNGPEAFSTLVSLTGGGWQLTDQYGTVDTFNSSGFLTSTELRTTQTTTYGWTNGDLTSITDAFGRSVTLAYTSGLLTSITNYASSVWSFGHDVSGDLTSVTEPNPGTGSPVWSFGYSNYLLTSVTDPNSNVTDYGFNQYYNLASDTLPGGGGDTYASEQNFGYGGGSQYQTTSAVLSSSVENSTTDPNGNVKYFSTDAFADPTFIPDSLGNQTTITRNANGLATQITLPPPTTGAQSPVTNISYDSLGNETSATGAQPTYGTYTFNTFSEPTSFTDALNNEWTWSYDTHGNLTSGSDPLNNSVSFTVDSLGYPTSMTQPAPNDGTGTVTTTYTRDSDERLTKITFPDNSTETFAYNTIDLPTSVTDEDNHTTTTNYDVLGRVTSVVNALNGTISTTYDKDNNVLTTQDELGNTTSYVWSSRNEMTQETLPAPAQGQQAPVLAWTYDSDGNELTYTNALSEVTSYTWDKLNRMTQETLPPHTTGGTKPSITFGYDNLSRKVSETSPLNATTTWAYANTDISQLTSVTLPPPSGSGNGLTTSYGFDADGRQNTVTDAMNHTTTTTFTADGEAASVKDNAGNTTSYAYGHGGELLSTTDALNHTTSDEYDSRYRLVETTDANNGVASLTLDGVGNVTKLVDSDNNATSWVFDALNRPTSETNALGTSYTTYNADSEVTSLEDADGRVRDFTLDNLGRVTAEQWMNGNTVVATMSYSCDLGNELTSASDPNSAYAFAYNGDGEVTSTDNNGTPNVPHVVLTAGYDLAGDLTSQSATITGTADFLNNYSYNDDQELTTVQQEQQSGGNTVANKEIDYAYNAIGQFTAIGYYDELSGPRTDIATGAFTYDADNRLTDLAYTSDGGQSSIDAFGWAYNAGSLVTSFTSNDGTASYSYDPTNQLTSATYTTNSGGHQPANESYSFDSSGNRNMTGYSTGSDNLTSSDGMYNYGYDSDGNLVSRTQIANTYSTDYKTTYTWDYRNRLTDVENYDNNGVLTQHVHYVYDVFNDLIATEVDTTGDGTYNVVQHYVLDVSPQVPLAGVPGKAPAQPELEFDGNDNLIGRNLVALNPAHVDAVMAQEATSTGVVTWMVDDNQGTPRDAVNNSSVVVNHIVYASAGQIAYQSAPTVAIWAGFAGAHTDPYTGLLDDYNRWYDPATEKFISQDPSGFSGGDVDLSRYAMNDPTNRADPTGLDSSPGFWYNYTYYLCNPSAQDGDIQVTQKVAIATAAVCFCAAVTIYIVNVAAASLAYNAVAEGMAAEGTVNMLGATASVEEAAVLASNASKAASAAQKIKALYAQIQQLQAQIGEAEAIAAQYSQAAATVTEEGIELGFAEGMITNLEAANAAKAAQVMTLWEEIDLLLAGMSGGI